jgi:transposase
VPTDELPIFSRSSAAEFHETIIRALEQGLSSQRIYQDLVTDHQAQISYDAVKRYVRKQKQESPKLVGRISTPPGEEAQVDFGQGAPTEKNGKYRKPWLFKLVLSSSRHSYEEVVWRQDVETFIRCHERAFESIGGVPKTIRLDNLKSGVLKAHLFEPELNPVYEQFSHHYGFVAIPCLPRTPEHKGKTEAGVKYTQDNALKGLRFESLEHQNAHLRTWNKTWARTRIHGTTKQQVWQMFLTERETLQPLPDSRFQFFKIGQRTVHADGHIEIQKSYYSVPYTFIGKRVTVHFNSDWVKVFIPLQGVPTMIAFHKATGAGRYQTSNKHIPEHKIFTNASYTQYLQKKSREIGEGCAKWVEKTLTERAQQAYRPIQGVFRLLDRYSQETVNRACIKALIQHSYRYHTVHLMCQDTESENQEDLMTTEHEIIRPPSEYGQYIERLSLRR